MKGEMHDFFAKTRPSRLFLAVALPGAVSMLASSLYACVDGVLVGRFLGSTAFAAQSFIFSFVVINFALADLIGVGSAVPISISLGRGDEEQANNIFSCACAMIVAAGAVIGAALYFAAPLIARLMGAEGELARLAVEYLRVYAVCSPLTTIIFAVDNYLRVCGYVRGSMALNIFMSAISCALEFLFLGVLGFGIWGASLATCLGMMVSAAIAFAPFFLGRAQLRFRRPRFSFAMTRRIVAAGAPNFLNNIAGRVTSIMMNMLLIRLGGADAVSVYGILMTIEYLVLALCYGLCGADAVSVYGILMTIEYLVLALCYGLCDGLQPAVGYNWGAGRYGRVKAIEKYCFASSAAVSFTSAAVIFIFPAQIASLFISDASPAFIEMAVYAMRLFSATYLLRWFSFATQSYMLAVERPAGATAISLSTALIFPVLLIFLLRPLGLTGLWLNFAGTALLAALLSLEVSLEVLRRFKKELRGIALTRLLKKAARQ